MSDAATTTPSRLSSSRSRKKPPPRQPSVYSLHVPLAAAAHGAGVHALLDTLLKHLAYDREQCHHTFQQLASFAQAYRQQQQAQQQQRGAGEVQHAQPQLKRPRRLKSTTRKALKFHDRLAGLLQLASGIPYHLLGGGPVAVLLGASVQRPREVYCLHLPPAMHTPGAAAPPSASAMSAASRKLMLTLLAEHATIAEWQAAPGPTKMWLLFRAPEGSLGAAPPGFTVKRAFALNLRKAFQVDIVTGSQQPSSSIQQHACHHPHQHHGDHAGGMEQLSQQLSLRMSLNDAGGGEGSSSTVWYQAGIHVKGLRAAEGER